LKAVVLAAGEGTRLRPFTYSRPKVMIPVGRKPILEYVVRALVENGINDIVMVVGYKKERIMSHFEDGNRFGARIEYAFQQRQLGTAHALLAAADAIDDEFLLVAGDNIIDGRTVKDLLQGEAPAMLVTRSEIPSKYGVIQASKGVVVSIVEKPEDKIGNVINTGMYRFTPDILKFMSVEPEGGGLGITHVLQKILPELNLKAITSTGKWIDAVYPWDLIGLNAAALGAGGQRIAGTVETGVTLKGPVEIGEGTRIRSGTYIRGPVFIGEGGDIGPNVTIFPSTRIGDEVQIEPFTFISQSVVMDNVGIGSHSHISHSVIDDGVKLGPGCFAPKGQAVTQVESEMFRLDEIGALVGENTSVGAGTVLSPGCIIGAGCRIGHHARIRDNLENRSVVF
jgi:UDP-N-acetylglucosamine diphosphorylase/glucosamine-1-phosphate N-acetyltransferase